ncbi:MAG: DNA polymerase III subunit beta [Acidobacteriota bacterium]
MEFVVGKTSILKELGFVQSVVERKTTIPVLSYLLIEARDGELSFRATDLDVSVTTSCEANVKEDGALCIQAKKLFEIVRSLPDADISFKCNLQDQVAISCERSKFKMPWLGKENFPEIQEFKGDAVQIPAELMRTFISRTVFAITNEESRYALNGAKFELSAGEIRLVATDGHRLAFIASKGEFNTARKTDVLIPRKTLGELAKLSSEGNETIEFGADENHLHFKVGKRRLSSRLLSGQFPNYELVLPKDNQNRVPVDSNLIASAIRRVSLMADERSHLIKFDITAGQISITSHAADIGEAGEVIPVDYSGPQITVGFNAQYLNDLFSVIQDGEVAFEFKDGNSQTQIRPAADGDYDFRYVVMPMRL